jgi:hypothetical protein
LRRLAGCSVCASPLCAGWIVGIVRIGNIITDAYRDRVSLVRTLWFMRIEGAASTGSQRMFLDVWTIRAAFRADGIQATFPRVELTLQKPSINIPAETDPCFVGVFHTLNQRRAQLYY